MLWTFKSTFVASMEIVHEGWLKKSPPEKRLWRAKWRRRWFVLRQSGQIPGQYILEYFTDQACRKLKGHIDLDQCEQVDAGVSLDVASRKCSYAHVFDIRTPKRLYYLVADSEADMNKWVDCICAVCGLKMHDEELEYEAQLNANTLTPPSAVAPTVIQPSPTPSNWYDPSPGVGGGTLTRRDSKSPNSLPLPPLPAPQFPSGPYIPISECHTGTNGFLRLLPDQETVQPESSREAVVDEYDDDDDDEDDDETFPDSVPPPPPKTLSTDGKRQRQQQQRLSAEFYDYPRQIHPRSLDEDFYSVPLVQDEVTQGRSPRLSADGGDANVEESMMFQQVQSQNTLASVPPPPPKVNWETYPRGDSDTVCENRRSYTGQDDTYDHPLPSSTTKQLARLSLTDSGVEIIHAESSSSPPLPDGAGSVESTGLKHDSSSSSQTLTMTTKTSPKQPPPRPPKPKPPHLIVSLNQQSTIRPNVNLYDNIEECEAMLYDIPPSAQGVFLSKNLPANAFAYLKDGESVDHTVPTASANVSLDEMYDFPRPLHEDQLNATPPAPSGDCHTWNRRHAYTNAPTTSMSQPDEDAGVNVDEYLSMDTQKQRSVGDGGGGGGSSSRRRASSGGEVYTDMCGETKSPSCIYSNVPSPMHKYDNVFLLENPPAVNRKLKPQRRASEVGIGSPPPSSLNTWSSNTDSTSSSKVADGTSSRIFIVHPPLVNRTLKPKRSMDSCDGVNAANVTTITLSPPPMGHHRRQTHKKRSFRRPKEIPSPNVAACHRKLLAASHLSNGSATMISLHPPLNRQTARSDRSSSDDDQSSTCSSRRNSSNDDHAPLKANQHLKSPSPLLFALSGRRHESEIQYLDLDLESDAANSVTTAGIASTANNNASAAAVAAAAAAAAVSSASASTHQLISQSPKTPKSPERFATNTVYKTVDFVKTKAFNEMRQNVEETYRKSQ